MRPKLAGVTEIAEMLGVSRQRADQLSRTRGFPDPVTKCLPLPRLWRAIAVEEWANENGRELVKKKAGRRP